MEGEDFVVMEGAGTGEGEVIVIGSSSSKHPNQPGVLHVDVEVLAVVVTVFVIFGVVVVDSSRQPHQPGVLQVSVLVRLDVDVDVDAGILDEVDVLVPLLSKNSHR